MSTVLLPRRVQRGGTNAGTSAGYIRLRRGGTKNQALLLSFRVGEADRAFVMSLLDGLSRDLGYWKDPSHPGRPCALRWCVAATHGRLRRVDRLGGELVPYLCEPIRWRSNKCRRAIEIGWPGDRVVQGFDELRQRLGVSAPDAFATALVTGREVFDARMLRAG